MGVVDSMGIVEEFFHTLAVKRLLIIEPGLTKPEGGHEAAFFHEIRRTCRGLSIEYRFYAHRSFDDYPDATPLFKNTPYIGDEDLAELTRDSNYYVEEFDNIPLTPGDVIFLSNATPWHLHSLDRITRDISSVKVSARLLLPIEFWTQDEDLLRPLRAILSSSLRNLLGRGAFICSEVGFVDLDEGRMTTPTLLSPVDKETLSNLMVMNHLPSRDQKVRFGFFGRPYEPKGFELILQAIKLLAQGEVASKQFCFFLPDGFSETVDRLNGFGSHVSAQSKFMNNQEYFSAMTSVDVVLCFYDPRYYANQMSGIATEALMLGKGVLVSRDSQPEVFVLRHAPGASIVADYTISSLCTALKLPKVAWETARRFSELSAKTARELKRSDRFLMTIVGP